MGLFDVFKKNNEIEISNKEEKDEEIKRENKENESIENDANYMLATVKEKDIKDNSL